MSDEPSTRARYLVCMEKDGGATPYNVVTVFAGESFEAVPGEDGGPGRTLVYRAGVQVLAAGELCLECRDAGSARVEAARLQAIFEVMSA